MGREIKFRAWNLISQQMHDVSELQLKQNGIRPNTNGGAVIHVDRFDVFCESEKLELMQYTGLRDKNGTEIYEGDIVKGHYYMNKQSHRIIGKVVYPYCYFCIDGVGQYSHIMRVDLDGSYEVIGNIYENADLLANTVSE